MVNTAANPEVRIVEPTMRVLDSTGGHERVKYASNDGELKIASSTPIRNENLDTQQKITDEMTTKLFKNDEFLL